MGVSGSDFRGEKSYARVHLPFYRNLSILNFPPADKLEYARIQLESSPLVIHFTSAKWHLSCGSAWRSWGSML
jgi:hypothetical protein